MVRIEWDGKDPSPIWPQVAFEAVDGPLDAPNRLYHGDAIEVMAQLSPATFQLIYMDPPFFTGRQFNMRDGGAAYSDVWAAGKESYLTLLHHSFLLSKQLLQPGGILAVHLDYRATAWARLLLDEVFGEQHFINEIIWHYKSGGRAQHHFSRKHDTILLYGNGKATLYPLEAGTKRGKPSNHLKRDGDVYTIRSNGRLYQYRADDLVAPDDVWHDIPHLQQKHPERFGYATQKPLVLLTRIIQTTTREGDLVGDFFCGSGTTLDAAQQIRRQWIGGDAGAQAIEIVRRRVPLHVFYLPSQVS